MLIITHTFELPESMLESAICSSIHNIRRKNIEENQGRCISLLEKDKCIILYNYIKRSEWIMKKPFSKLFGLKKQR